MAIAQQRGYDDLPALLTLQTGDEKHDWSSISTLDVLWVLYDRVLSGEKDDRFLLSKGHGPTAYYAVLAAKGSSPSRDLAGFGTFRLAARLSPGSGARAGRRDQQRLTRPRATAIAVGRVLCARRAGLGRARTASSATRSSKRAATGKPSSTQGASVSAG